MKHEPTNTEDGPPLSAGVLAFGVVLLVAVIVLCVSLSGWVGPLP